MKEQISALMDGELEGHAADQAIAARRAGGEALETWRLYHLIGDGMRDTRELSAGFRPPVTEPVPAEPTVLTPGRLPGPTPVRRFAYAAAASLAALALVGWLAFG